MISPMSHGAIECMYLYWNKMLIVHDIGSKLNWNENVMKLKYNLLPQICIICRVYRKKKDLWGKLLTWLNGKSKWISFQFETMSRSLFANVLDRHIIVRFIILNCLSLMFFLLLFAWRRKRDIKRAKICWICAHVMWEPMCTCGKKKWLNLVIHALVAILWTKHEERNVMEN